MIIYKDEKFGFMEIFNEKNGTLIRGDINGTDPVMRSFPELLDIGIMGHCVNNRFCKNAGIDCYQRGYAMRTSHMTLNNFKLIVQQASGKTFQFALGGAGDPNKHPQFEGILKMCREYHIIPNITTSGFLITDNDVRLIRQYCGAVAVSWYSRLNNGMESNAETINVLKNFINAGCITNVHYVVSKNSIDEAIERLKKDLFPTGISSVIFILYKPVGDGTYNKVLRKEDDKIETFLSHAINRKHPYRIGFDTCFTPAILKYSGVVPTVCINACEASTFSMYIDSQLNCYPCSFGIWNKKFSESLLNKTLKEIWLGDKFSLFRNTRKDKCVICEYKQLCMGGCKLGIDIDLCY